MSNTNDDSEPADDLIARALRAAGPRRELPDALAREWEALLRSELGAQAHLRRRRNRQRVLAVAACVALLAVALALIGVLPTQTIEPDATLATVVHVDGVGEVDGTPLESGRGLGSAARLRTGPTTFVGLAYRGADVRIGRESEIVVHRTRLELVRGTLYVDTGDDSVTTPIVVESRLGSFSHVGTQFVVTARDGVLDGAVRQGSIFLRTAWTRRQLSARSGEAAVVRVTASRDVDLSFEPLRGDRWQWIGAASPGFEVEGKTTAEAIHWAAREAGMRVEYGDAAAAQHARRTMLHGNAVARSLDDLLGIVDASTRLLVRPRDDGAIEVSLASEPNQDPH